MGAKNTEKRRKQLKVCVFFVPTYGNDIISVGGHRKNTDQRNCSRLSKHCTKPAFEDEMCPKDQMTATVMAAVATADENYDCI